MCFKKLIKPVKKQVEWERIQKEFHISKRRAYRLIGISISTKRYKPRDKSEEEKITESIQAVASRWKRFGYRRIHMMLKKEDIRINHKKVYRLYKKAGLTLKRKLKGKIYAKQGTPNRSYLLGPNDSWSMDFDSDVTATGRRFHIFTMIDEVSRECMTLEVDTSITGQQITRYLSKPMLFRVRSKEILSDNGPEFTSNALSAWTCEKHIEQVFIVHRKPMQNRFIESSNGKPRDEYLNLN